MHGDFTLYSPAMKRDITFFEEEEFSLNALTNSSNEKGPVVQVTNRKKDKHPQFQAIAAFKELIEKEEPLYSTLFALNNPDIHESFWKTIELLPVNKQLIRRIENCANFQQKEWAQLLKGETDESLQYHLNIIHELMEKNQKWVALFFSSGGMHMVVELLATRLKDEQTGSERITNRCILILSHVLETVSKIEDPLLEELNLILIAKLLTLFKGDLAAVTITIESLNHIFHLLQAIGKLYKLSSTELELPIMLKILEYGLFRPKSKTTLEFIEQDFEHYLINHYAKEEEKLAIYSHLVGFLKVEFLAQKEHSELLYIFMIDFMNTFVSEEHALLQQ
jgi:hypothetical protein